MPHFSAQQREEARRTANTIQPDLCHQLFHEPLEKELATVVSPIVTLEAILLTALIK
jgi:hypothetical protein